MSQTYRLLIHARLHEALQKEARMHLVPLAKTLSLLQLGYWGGGTRVKKLRSFDRPVFEARLNDADRVIFTLAHTASSEPPYRTEPHLFVWDIVTHDALERRRFNLQPEASFVEFPVVAAADLESPPACAPGSLAESTDAAALRAAVEGAGGVAPPEDSGEAIRWYVVDPGWVLDDAAWQAILDGGGADVELKLTREQYEVLTQTGPVLLSGAAGSGKTTLTVHWLARHAAAFPASRVLYVTYSEPLLEQVRDAYHNLLRSRGAVTQQEPAFLTFSELYGRLSGKKQEPVRYPRFADWYGRMTARTDAALAWEEIRGIQKGACLDPEQRFLSKEDYAALGRKRAPLFVEARPRLYAMGQRYQQWLDAEGLADDIDMARAGWRALRGRREAAYDAIVCDEVQDLTEIEMNLLLDLSRDAAFRGMLITGDPQQIVNPSGFRWADLRSLFLRKFRVTGQAVPDVRRLTRNFRSVRGIVAVANAFLAVQRQRTGRSDDDLTEDGVTLGPTPFVVRGSEAEVLEAVKRFGPRCAVITSGVEQADRLRREIGSTRVFDVAGSKGLEFDAVILWDLMRPDEAAWRDLLTGTANCREDPVLRRMVHHAYVAVTRSRQWLAVYETGSAAELWDAPALRACFERDAPAALRALLATQASPEDWAKEAAYYAGRRRYLQASECYRRAGLHEEAEGAEAKGLDEVGRYREAAARYLGIGRKADAAESYARAGDVEHAAAMLREIGKPERAEEVLLEHWVRVGAWGRAAEIHERRGALGEAAEAYTKAGQPAHATRLRVRAAREVGDWAEVGRLEVQRQAWAAAAEAFEQAGKAVETTRCRAHLAEHQGDMQRAAALWREVGDEARARRLVASVEDLIQRATALERNDHHSLRRALGLWQQILAQRPDAATEKRVRAIEAELKQGWMEAAKLYHELELWRGVIRVVQPKAALIDSMGEDYAGGSVRDMMKYVDLGDEATIRLAEEESGIAAALEVAMRMRWKPHVRPLLLELQKRAERWRDATHSCVELRRWNEARECAAKALDPRFVRQVDALQAEAEQRWLDAEQAWEAAGVVKKAAGLRAKRLEAARDYEGAADAWDLAGQRAKARRLRKGLGSLGGPDGASGLPPGPAREEAMIAYMIEHPGCTRQHVLHGLQLTPGEAQDCWWRIERNARVATYRMGNRRVYGPAGWPKKAETPVAQTELFESGEPGPAPAGS